MKALFLFFTALLFSSLAATQEPGGYMLNAGDTIRIHVYGEPDLTFERLLVGHNGIVSYPFLGDIKVAGTSVSNLQTKLVDGLKPDYLIDPRVSVSVVSYRPFFVNGEVKSPGGVEFQPGLTLRKAVSLAGGFTERASKSNIYVISDNDTSKASRKVDLAYQVQPGDIITVEQSFF
ncbi:MAG: polysaccharide biosynthesis/export family protein [Pseudomonadales bacterium]